MRATLLLTAALLFGLVAAVPAAEAGTRVTALVNMAERCPLHDQVALDRCTVAERIGVFALWEVGACVDHAAIVEYVVAGGGEQRAGTVFLGPGECFALDGFTRQPVADCMTAIVNVMVLGDLTENLRGQAEDTECAVAAYGDVVNSGPWPIP